MVEQELSINNSGQENEFPNFGEAFVVLEKLESPGEISLWKVMDKNTQKFFLFKTINLDSHVAKLSTEKITTEFSISESLDHPNLPIVYAMGHTLCGRAFLQIHYQEGRLLSEILKNSGHLSYRSGEAIFEQISQALQYLHVQGIVHRAINPSNILISGSENSGYTAILNNFSKSARLDVSLSTSSNDFEEFNIEQLLYASPEQCLGEEYTAESDLYSLACVFYEMLTGEPPFKEKNIAKLILRQVNEQPDLNKIPQCFRRVMSAYLSKDKQFRRVNPRLNKLGRIWVNEITWRNPVTFSAIVFGFFQQMIYLTIVFCCCREVFQLNVALAVASVLVAQWYSLLVIRRISNSRNSEYRTVELATFAQAITFIAAIAFFISNHGFSNSLYFNIFGLLYVLLLMLLRLSDIYERGVNILVRILSLLDSKIMSKRIDRSRNFQIEQTINSEKES